MKLYYREWHFPQEPAQTVRLSEYRSGVHQRFTS